MVDKVLRTRPRGPSFGCVCRLATRRIMLPAVFPVFGRWWGFADQPLWEDTRRSGHALCKSPGAGVLIEDAAAKYRRKRADSGPAGRDWPEWSSRRRFGHSRHFPIIFRRAAGAFP